MSLYIRSAEDNPHAMDPEVAGLAKCGEVLLRAIEITEAQAIIWLDDRRCSGCYPGYQHKAGRHHQHGNNMDGRAARWLSRRAA